MRKTFVLFVALFFSFSCSQKEVTPIDCNIIPKPTSITKGTDWISWEKDVLIISSSEDEMNVASMLQDFLKTKNIQATISSTSTTIGKQIILSTTKETFSRD